MKKKEVVFLGKVITSCLIINFIALNFTAKNISAKGIAADEKKPNISSVQNPAAAHRRWQSGTLIAIETSAAVSYKSHFLDNPARLVLAFEPYNLSSDLKEEIIINRGMVKKAYCRYYTGQKAPRWVKSITFLLLAKTSYKIKQDESRISILIQNTPEESIKSTLADELVISDYTPRGWGSVERRRAILSAIKFIKIKRHMMRSLTNQPPPAVVIEKKEDNSLRISASDLTPGQMIITGAKALLSQPHHTGLPKATPILNTSMAVPSAAGRNSNYGSPDFIKASVGLMAIMLGVLAVNRSRSRRLGKKKKPASKAEPNAIEELFLKDEELEKWPKYQQAEHKPAASAVAGMHPREIFNLPSAPMDIAERRRYPRADVRNARGILSRALVGSKTQPFKNMRVNDISRGGLSFQVKSRDIKFRSPTIIKLYFSNSTKPVDLWVRVVWERDDAQGDGKNVGVKFTKVPKESWDKIIEAFGHRLG